MTEDRSADRSVLDFLKQSRVLSYTLGALSLIAGLVLVFRHGPSFGFVARLAGVLLLVVGLTDLVDTLSNHRKLNYWGLLAIRDLINLGFGAALLFWPGPTITTLVWLVGLDLVVTGVLGLVVRTRMPAEYKSAMLTRSLVTIVAGIAVMAWPSTVLKVIAVVVGVVFCIFGLTLLWAGRQLSHLSNAVKDGSVNVRG